MRQVEGYVFIAQFEEITLLFGKRVELDNSDGEYSNFELNGLTSYTTQEQALKGAKEFENKRTSCKGTRVARIEMKLAENKKDLELLKEGESLVVVKRVPNSLSVDKLLGPYDPEKGAGEYPLPGTRLTQNGFVTFVNSVDKNAYKQAEYVASEVSRQGECKATLATFLLEEIS